MLFQKREKAVEGVVLVKDSIPKFSVLTVARSKAKAVTRRVSLVDSRMYTELKKTGTIIQTPTKTKYYCISCAVHQHNVSQRAKSERRT